MISQNTLNSRTKKEKSFVTVKTAAENRYVFDKNIKKAVVCHPIFYFMLQMEEKGIAPKRWIEQIKSYPIKIEDCGAFTKKEIEYYYNKYSLLKKNGYFSECKEEEKGRIRLTANDIERSLANSTQLTLEVTDQCDLQCVYCGYGKFYSDYDKRENKSMDIKVARNILSYLAKFWNSPLNVSHDQNIYIGFYGGEPLLNMPFIRQVVKYAKDLPLIHNRFTFSMTTNALQLAKHMDYLVENDFNLLISLDGNEENNQYRVLKNGKPAYQYILNNINALRDKYPEYFNRKVNFNAVLHNKNSIPSVYRYFKRHFNKIPDISPLNTSGINEAAKEDFSKTYINYDERLFDSKDYEEIEKEMFIKLPNIQEFSTFIHQENDFSFDNYNELLAPQNKKYGIPTGTCIPFSKKIFITVNGKVLPCERIGQQYGLGTVNSTRVILDFEDISKRYNEWFDKVRCLCEVCNNSDNCSQCIFNLNVDGTSHQCSMFLTHSAFSRRLSSYLELLEKKPDMYSRILKEIRIY